MNPLAKLAAFLVALAATFGVSYLAGTQSAALLAPVELHDEAMVPPRASVEGFGVRVLRQVLEPDEDVRVEFALTGPDGGPATDLHEVDGQLVHVIAFRRDLTGYQHTSPERGEGASWSAVLNLTPGPWHLIVDLEPAGLGREITLATDFTVSGDYHPAAVSEPAESADAGGLTVRQLSGLGTRPESLSRFAVTDGGRPVTDLQPESGLLGHCVIIRPADLGYRHLHPSSTGTGPDLDFTGGVPAAGRYVVFVEFSRQDRLHVARFTVDVRQ